MTIVYCGNLGDGGTCLMRLRALQNLAHTVEGVETMGAGLCGLSARLLRKIGYTMDPAGASRRLLEAARGLKANVVWIDKGLSISPLTLQAIRRYLPSAVLLHYSPDDMTGGPHNQSRAYLDGIPLYDLHVTTKSFNVDELRSRGARDVLFLNNAYCPQTHRPVVLSSKEHVQYGGAVGFIGAFERERAESLWFLARNGIPTRVWGGGWHRWAKVHRHPLLIIEDRWVWGDRYTKTVCAFDINLGFLRKLNRDLQTTRSVEIPACGAFLLAERTAEHRQLFTEGTEAEFFGNDEELLSKCRAYLGDSAKRSEVAAAGRRRCLNSNYSYVSHVEAALHHLATIQRRTNAA